MENTPSTRKRNSPGIKKSVKGVPSNILLGVPNLLPVGSDTNMNPAGTALMI